MGWELKNADEDVDICNCKIDAFEKLPLGSYFEDIFNNDEKSFQFGNADAYVENYR